MSAEYSVEHIQRAIANMRVANLNELEVERMLTAYAERIKADEGAVPKFWITTDDLARASHEKPDWCDNVVACPHIESAPEKAVFLYIHPPAQAAQVDAYCERNDCPCRMAVADCRHKKTRDTTHPHSPDAADSGRVQWRGFAIVEDSSVPEGMILVRDHLGRDVIINATLAAQGQGDSDGMCNEDHPERRCICREEFGHRVCGTTPPASPAGVPDGLVEVSALRNLIRGNGGWASCFNDESFVMWKDIERLIAAPSATPEGGEVGL